MLQDWDEVRTVALFILLHQEGKSQGVVKPGIISSCQRLVALLLHGMRGVGFWQRKVVLHQYDALCCCLGTQTGLFAEICTKTMG